MPLYKPSSSPTTPGGRLTLTTATPVLVTTVAAATAVLYTPYQHSFIPLNIGNSVFVSVAFTELTNTLSDATKNPAAVTTNSNYDMFVWNDAGTIRLSRGPAWTGDNTRGSGAGTTQLSQLTGVLVNTVAITNGPAANMGTYVGTIRTNGTSTTDFDVGSFATTGSQRALIGIWNAYNRSLFRANVQDSTTGYTYTTATIRAARADNGNRVSIVQGLVEGVYEATYQNQVLTAAALTGQCELSIGVDSTSSQTASCDVGVFKSEVAGGAQGSVLSTAKIWGITLGFHFIQALEKSDGTNANTFNVTANYNGLRVSGWY